jgi:hypothetical protein
MIVLGRGDLHLGRWSLRELLDGGLFVMARISGKCGVYVLFINCLRSFWCLFTFISHPVGLSESIIYLSLSKTSESCLYRLICPMKHDC